MRVLPWKTLQSNVSNRFPGVPGCVCAHRQWIRIVQSGCLLWSSTARTFCQSSPCIPPTCIRHLDLRLFSWLPTFRGKLITHVFWVQWYSLVCGSFPPRRCCPSPQRRNLHHTLQLQRVLGAGLQRMAPPRDPSAPCPPSRLLAPTAGSVQTGMAFIHITAPHGTLDPTLWHELCETATYKLFRMA